MNHKSYQSPLIAAENKFFFPFSINLFAFIPLNPTRRFHRKFMRKTSYTNNDKQQIESLSAYENYINECSNGKFDKRCMIQFNRQLRCSLTIHNNCMLCLHSHKGIIKRIQNNRGKNFCIAAALHNTMPTRSLVWKLIRRKDPLKDSEKIFFLYADMMHPQT